jgi:phosphoribosyl 1,2-cyclic phosphodiesterase
MRVRFYGTRGSIATPGPATVKYGGNTSCVSIRSKAGTLILIDVGTGASVAGRELMAGAGGKPIRGHILISHTHWDHIQGLPFFAPLFVPGNEWDIYAPRGLRQTLRETLEGQMQHLYFPVDLDQLGATIRYHELVEGALQVGDVSVRAQYLNHPALTLGYRLEADGATVVYACDHEPHARALAEAPGEITGQDLRHAHFLARADLAIHDAQYVASEYGGKVGWGHSTIEYAVGIAAFAKVKRLALTHHDPIRTDAALDAILETVHAQAGHEGMEVFAAVEGQAFELEGDGSAIPELPAAAAELPIGNALIGTNVLVATTRSTGLEALTEALDKDEMRWTAASYADAAAVAAATQPSLLVIDDADDKAAIDLARAVRTQGADLPIVLVCATDAAAPDGLFDDRLVAPFSSSYARAKLRAALLRKVARWQRAAKPHDEVQRIATLRSLDVLDTPPEERFDRITRLAAALFDVPVALISLVDENRQWFKSSCGLDASETPRDESFCAHAVVSREPLIIPDALLDPRFADNPVVSGPTRVRFYAGAPLILSDGSCIGTLCIIDTRPRELDAAAIARLRDLAALARQEFEQTLAAAMDGTADTSSGVVAFARDY